MSVSPNDLMDITQRLESLEREQMLRRATEEETINDLSVIKNEINHLRSKENVMLGHEKKKLGPIKSRTLSAMNNDETNSPISINYLSQKITDLEGETQQLKNQLKQALKRMETTSDKFKSLNDFKQEFKAFFSRNGHSVLLETGSIFKKVFWLSCMIVLFVTGMILVDRNVKGFQAHDVVTQIKVIDVETLTFPAITFCLTEYHFDSSNSLSDVTNLTILARDLSNVIIECYFEISYHCTFQNDFEHFQMYTDPFSSTYIDCYKFNADENKISKKVGLQSGLYLTINLSQSDVLLYNIGENNVNPSFHDLKMLSPKNNYVEIGIEKTIDLMLPNPYSNCTEHINSETSDLVREILDQNLDYNQKSCYEFCFRKYLGNYASSQNITLKKAYEVLSFDYKGNCSQLCPLECSSTFFQTFKSEINVDSSLFWLNFYFTDRKYTEISQTVKTTGADLISNTGGVLGLLLEFSFFSVSRFIIYFYDFIFV